MLAEAQAGQNRWEDAEQNVSFALKSQPQDLDANLAQCAILLRRTTVASNVYPILDQFNHTLTLMGPYRNKHQNYIFKYLVSIYYGLLGMTPSAHEQLKEVYCTKEQYADVKAVLALLP